MNNLIGNPQGKTSADKICSLEPANLPLPCSLVNLLASIILDLIKRVHLLFVKKEFYKNILVWVFS